MKPYTWYILNTYVADLDKISHLLVRTVLQYLFPPNSTGVLSIRAVTVPSGENILAVTVLTKVGSGCPAQICNL